MKTVRVAMGEVGQRRAVEREIERGRGRAAIK